MGYRSDGRWVIKGSVEDIAAAWAACRLTLTPPANEPDAWDMFDVFKASNEGFIRFEFNDWKWYTGFELVDFYESVWTTLNDLANNEGSTLSGKRIHIGEDSVTEDNCFGGGGSYDIDLYVSCTFDDREPSEGEPL